jgi:hypothetical protein
MRSCCPRWQRPGEQRREAAAAAAGRSPRVNDRRERQDVVRREERGAQALTAPEERVARADSMVLDEVQRAPDFLLAVKQAVTLTCVGVQDGTASPARPSTRLLGTRAPSIRVG